MATVETARQPVAAKRGDRASASCEPDLNAIRRTRTTAGSANADAQSCGWPSVLVPKVMVRCTVGVAKSSTAGRSSSHGTVLRRGEVLSSGGLTTHNHGHPDRLAVRAELGGAPGTA
jgi:hypothetical protein